MMTELIALFAEWLQDINSVPFAHEAEWADGVASVERAA